jgi:Holliday junction resolvasome RuvABC endonuclease subunit
MKTILALDLGTRMGWAWRDSTGLIDHGSEDFAYPKNAPMGKRFVNFQNWLDGPGALEFHDVVIYEDVRRHAGTAAAHMYGGFQALLLAQCVRRNVPTDWLGVGEIKKHATGKGNAPKDAVIAAMQARGFQPQDDNDADALALLFAYLDKEEA